MAAHRAIRTLHRFLTGIMVATVVISSVPFGCVAAVEQAPGHVILKGTVS